MELSKLIKLFITTHYVLLLVTSTSNINALQNKYQFVRTGKSQQGTTICKEVGMSCEEDCECCGHDEKPAVHCENRNEKLGYKCYKSVGLSGQCTEDKHCRSQKCKNGRCVKYYPRGPKLPVCQITEFLSVDVVKGSRIDTVCNCDAPPDPKAGDALKAVDNDTNSVYENYWAIGGGIELELKERKKVNGLRICNSPDCPECDPLCYKIEGYCGVKSNWEIIQEGDLRMPFERNKCATIKLTSLNTLHSKYRITFPCQRGGCRDECEGICHEKPIQNPLIESCPNPVATPPYGSMSLISRRYENANNRTLFLYEIHNIELLRIKMSWIGDCLIDYYYAFKVSFF